MAMNVNHDKAATYSLSQLNANNSQLNKSLKQISSGQKLNSYGDNSADYSISERMRVQIRSLKQNAQNVKNGSAMLQTALAGAQTIVDLLREMKKIAIESADDSASYEDRKTLQKELLQRIDTINDIAVGTEYNGKRLIDGTYTAKTFSLTGVATWSDPKKFTMLPGKTYTKTVNADGSRTIVGKNNLDGIASAFNTKDSTISRLSNTRAGAGFDCAVGFDGSRSDWNWATEYRNWNFNGVSKTVYFEDTETKPSTPQQVIKALMHSFDETTKSGMEAFDEAINYSTGGTIKTKDQLVQKFMADLNGSANYTDFLKNYCDIILDNADTGAITGSDAGGGGTKTAESIVPETGFPVTSNGVQTLGSVTTINGLNVHWPTSGVSGTLTAAEEHILAGLNSDWIEQSLKLVKDTYGIDFNERGATVRDINVKFESTNNNALAYVTSTSVGSQTTKLDLVVNMYYYKDIDPASPDGALLPTSSMRGVGYLDRTIAHEFTHAVMSANIDNFRTLPHYVREGTAELVHGIDDERAYTIKKLLTTDKGSLQSALSSGGSNSDGEVSYAAGYMILRYLAKQGQGHQISKVDKNYDGKFSKTPPTGKETGVEIDFSGATPTDPTVNFVVPDCFHKEGFSILCGGCRQYINIVFDKDMSIGTSTLSTSATDSLRKDYVIGIGGATTTDDLAEALFEGIANAPGRSTANDIYVTYGDGSKELVCVGVDSNHNVRIAKNPNYSDDPTVAGSSRAKYIFLKQSSPALDFFDGGTVEASGGRGSKDDVPAGTSVEELDGGKTVNDENGNPIPHIQTVTVDEETEINIWEPTIGNVTIAIKNPIVIHDGTQAGQNTYYYLQNMRTNALTAGEIFNSSTASAKNLISANDRARYDALSSNTAKQEEWLATLKSAANKTVDDISVTTQKDANVAICVLDGAIDYALDVVTDLGAYVQRLEINESNIVSKDENTTAAESTIRDIDMARAMTSYTGAKIRSQSAQAMLAQSNQNSSNVLTLLQ
ncbi:MAG: flagellin [Selenomonadaceae bacterium]|nr:flagellin [Selenomonadaceae bacterium]